MLSHVFLLKVFMIRRLVCCKSLKSNGDINTAVLFSAWVFIRSTHGNKGMTKVSYKPLCMFKTSSCNGGETRASETLIWKWNGRSWTDSPIRQTISSHSLMLGALSTTQQNPVDDGVSGESLWREPMVCVDRVTRRPITSQLPIASLPVGEWPTHQAGGLWTTHAEEKQLSAVFSRWLDTESSTLLIVRWILTPRRTQILCNPAGWTFLHMRSQDSGAQTVPGKIYRKKSLSNSTSLIILLLFLFNQFAWKMI